MMFATLIHSFRFFVPSVMILTSLACNDDVMQTGLFDAVSKASGFIEASIGKPTKWVPDEYVMISVWASEQSLVDFVGVDWNEAHIPEGMEKFVDTCRVHHYRSF